MSFPKDFLTALAKEKELTSKETEVFLALFGDDKSRVQITQELAISDSALGTRLTGIYNKFKITGSGPVKESRLKDYLTHRYQHRQSAEPSVIHDSEQSIDALVRQVRSRCCEAILDSYSKIRLPDDTRIDVDLLYVDVYVLKKLSSKRYASISGLLEGVEQREDYERLALGQRQERLPGQEIVRQFPRLMVLGKPGSGKTTFLRHLAVDCSKGKLFCDRIPVLIELRSIKEGNSFNLLNLIHREFGLAEPEQTKQILNEGKAFILLDGLDEVPSQLRQSVRDQIYEFAKEYRKNRFVLTCRTQTIEYIAEHFESIEVANFDAQQVKIFAHNWFTATPETSGEAEGWASKFVEKLEENKQICELAVIPILLTLTCLLFTAEQDLPKKRAELYEKGLDLLLKQWDTFREIPRDYQQLSALDKQKLLSYLASRKFEQPDNFILFEQDEIQEYIAEYLGIDVEESEALLEAIEAHHGLLIERAQNIWSFSHLTFQEYFAAKYIVDNYTPEEAFQHLAKHITEPRWQEVFLITVSMVECADILLRLIKEYIDELILGKEELQRLLHWANEQANLSTNSYCNSKLRAYYFKLALDRVIFSLSIKIYSHRNQDIVAGKSGRFPLTSDLQLNFEPDPELKDWLNEFYNCYLEFSFGLYVGRLIIIKEDYAAFSKLVGLLEDEFLEKIYSLQLKRELEIIFEQIPVSSPFKLGEFQKWWKFNGKAWLEKLKNVLIEHRNIPHDWQFGDEQKKLLQQYYDANKLLVDCLSSGCNVSQRVRQEIEETLLLPIAEIQKRQQRG
jgi:predicted NACHT family NTPase